MIKMTATGSDIRRMAKRAKSTIEQGGAELGHGSAVSMCGVTHAFSGKQALDGLDIEVPYGRVTVLLGPNGAGKTTAFRAITGALEPDEGQVESLGFDPVSQGSSLRRRCGVVSAKPALYDRLTGRDNMLFAAELHGMGRRIDARLNEVAGRFGILDALESMVGGYSTGMKTRLALARAVLHHPELVLFDEPTSGLDPESAQAVLALIRDMTVDGSTVVMCTHLLSEAEGLADHIVMMEAGRAVIAGSPESLTERFWPNPVVELEAEDPRILDRIASWDVVISYERSGMVARIEMADLNELPDLVTSLVRDGARLGRIDPQRPTLEDLYFMIRRNEIPERSGVGSADSAIRGLAPVGHNRSHHFDSAETSPIASIDSVVPSHGSTITGDAAGSLNK